jgi:hypothetical protein
MKQFELAQWTRVNVTGVNVRSEMHGSEHVPAVDLKFKLTTANTILDELVPPLRQQLYMAAGEDYEPEEPEFEEVTPVTDTPLLRCEDLEPLQLKKKFEGWTVEFDYGRGGKSNIVLPGCTVDKFVVDAKQGGSVEITFRAQTSNVKSDTLGKLGVMIGLEQTIRILAPLVNKPIDGSSGPGPGDSGDDQPKGDAPKSATELFAAGGPPEKTLDERIAAGEPAWPFPKNASTEAPPQSVTIEQSQPSTRTARGREQTAKALAAGPAGAAAA